MTKEEKEILESDIAFLSHDIALFNVDYALTSDGKKGVVRIRIDKETKVYEAWDFCQRIYITYGKYCDSQVDTPESSRYEKQHKILCQAKSYVINITENLKNNIEDVESCKKYDFSGVIMQIDSLIERAKLNFDALLLNSQVEANKDTVVTNKNIRETNENINKSNTVMQRILRLTALIAVISAGVTTMTLIHEYGKDSSEHTIKQKDTTIQLLQTQFSQIKRERDSLKSTLDSAKDNP